MELKLKSLKKVKKEIITPPRIGEIVEGTIITQAKNSLFLDLGAKGVGVIYGEELRRAKDFLRNLKPGDKVVAKVLSLENEEGYRELSALEASEEFTWKELQDKKAREEVLELKVRKANKGGLVFEVNGIPGFLPASQLAPEHYPKVKNGDTSEIARLLQKFVGETFQVKIMDIDPKKKKLIFTEKGVKATTEEKEKTEAASKHKKGEEVEGEVTGVTSFGAFVNLKDGVEALLRKEDVPENVFKELAIGKKVKAKIIEISDGTLYLGLLK